MTKLEVATAVAEAVNRQTPNQAITPQVAQEVINALTSTIIDAVADGDTVTIRQFGTFGTKRQKAKVARNITKGEAMQLPERVKPMFKPSPDFVNQVRTYNK